MQKTNNTKMANGQIVISELCTNCEKYTKHTATKEKNPDMILLKCQKCKNNTRIPVGFMDVDLLRIISTPKTPLHEKIINGDSFHKKILGAIFSEVAYGEGYQELSDKLNDLGRICSEIADAGDDKND